MRDGRCRVRRGVITRTANRKACSTARRQVHHRPVDAGISDDAHCWVRGLRSPGPNGSIITLTPGGMSVVDRGGSSMFSFPRHTIAGLGRIAGMWKERAVAGELIARTKRLRGCLTHEPSVAAGIIEPWCDFEIGPDGHIRDIVIRYSSDNHYVVLEHFAVKVPGYLRPVHDCLLAELHDIEFPRPAPTDFACTSIMFDATAVVPQHQPGRLHFERDLDD
jgi:hypothetical protein